MINKFFWGFAITAITAFGLAAAPNPDMVAKVKSGQIKEARASWWGFNANDSTEFLQAAINSKVPKLIIDSMPNTWNIDPIRLVSNQEIIFEPGAKIAAKRTSFQDRNATLFTLSKVTNVVIRGSSTNIRMYRDDYAQPPYDMNSLGGRHAFSILGSANVTLDGLVISQSGGAGINVDCGSGNPKIPTTNLKIQNCTIEKATSYGIRLGGVMGAVIDNLTIREISGSWPGSGITLNSHSANHLLRNIELKNTRIENCKGYAIEVNVSGDRPPKAPPLTVLCQNITATACEMALHYSSHSKNQKYPRGMITFEKCNFSFMRRNAAKISQKPRGSVSITFNNCEFKECCQKLGDDAPDFELLAGRYNDPPVDDLLFKNVVIYHGEKKRPWISKVEGNWMMDDIKNITGNLRVYTEGSKKDYKLDSFWRKANFPPKSKGVTPNRVEFDPEARNISVIDTARGAGVSLSPVQIRGEAMYAFCVERKRVVKLRCRYIPVNKRRSSHPIVIRRYGWKNKSVAEIPLPDFNEEGSPDSELSFEVPGGGFYSMEVRGGGNIFTLTYADVPIAIDVSKEAQRFANAESVTYITPARGKPFAVFVNGNANFNIVKNDGTSALKGDGVEAWSRFLGTAPGIKDVWKIEMKKKEKGGIGDYMIDLVGMPGFLFLSNKKLWRMR